MPTPPMTPHPGHGHPTPKLVGLLDLPDSRLRLVPLIIRLARAGEITARAADELLAATGALEEAALKLLRAVRKPSPN